MTRAVVVFAALLLLAAVGVAVDVGAHRLRHRYGCWRAGRRRVRDWNRIRRQQAAQAIAAACIPPADDADDPWDRLHAAIQAEQQPGTSAADLHACQAIWNLDPIRREGNAP